MPIAAQGVLLLLSAILITAPLIFGSHPPYLPPPWLPPVVPPHHLPPDHWISEPVILHPPEEDLHVWVTSLDTIPPRRLLYPHEVYFPRAVSILKIRYRPLAYLLASSKLTSKPEDTTTTEASTIESTTTAAPTTESTTTAAPTTESTTTAAPTTESTTAAASTSESTTTTAAPTS